MNYRDHRARIYEWLRLCLIGPGAVGHSDLPHEVLVGVQPLELYHTAVLFPIVSGEWGVDPADSDESPSYEEEDSAAGPGEEAPDKGVEPVAVRRRYIPPSSVGFSFFIAGPVIEIDVSATAVRYKNDKPQYQRAEWERIQLPKAFWEGVVTPPKEGETPWKRHDVFDGRAELFILWRKVGAGWLATVSLSNIKRLSNDEQQAHEWRQSLNQFTLFEVQLECNVLKGEVGPYPRVDKSLLSEEEQELELQYKARRIYAVGHGAAVDWEEKKERVAVIRTEFLPKVETPEVSTDAVGVAKQALDMAYLAQCNAGAEEIFKALDTFVSSYEAWRQARRADCQNLDDDEHETGERILCRVEKAEARMRQGIKTLRTDGLAARAFGLANKAMHAQMEQFDTIHGLKGKPKRWRPFQLAFLLLVLESAIHEESEFRDTLDLIWFPTGGGKTEAYLGLIAFLVLWRRLKFPSSGGGTTVLMRYTLRLLTQQQFIRATRLICALELLRRSLPALGKTPISVGIWVGEATSPNTCAKAHELVQKAIDSKTEPPRKLILTECPWCGQKFQASQNFITTPDKFEFLCRNSLCEFGRRQPQTLPCAVVDEAIYDAPPTLLIATIDKFARLAWDERTSAFFGRNGNLPPALIIQDELHLISGALGSIAGVYEAAVDTVLTCRDVRPKYIASTATIRMATRQVERLYGREVAVFPPPGLSCDDSYFARVIPLEEKPGRLYVGYLAPNLKRQHAMSPLAAALLTAPEVLFQDHKDREDLLDAWWTLVVYHGSLKGVGASHNAFNIQVPDYLKLYSKNKGEGKEGRCGGQVGAIEQLTSLATAEENASIFERLGKGRNDPEHIAVALATNMISVGLDVARLAVMIVIGQPLTTAEYIQATSRVGRGETPGLVLANYYRDQARSLSHYENFRSYHESFYRFVEPSGTTPYTYQARRRALHAALVIAVRHSCPQLQGNQHAGKFDPNDPCVARVVQELTKRCARADKGRGDGVAQHLQFLVAQWKDAVECSERNHRRLDYQCSPRDRATDRLLHNHDDKITGLWPTLQSMRNVESTALLKQL